MSTDTGRTSHRDDLPSIDRLLALSDGVVAIALTLLVLQLRVPSMSQVPDQNSAAALAAALGKGGDSLVSYVISFYVVAQFWLVHHRVFQHLAGQREGLAWLNFAFLFTITIMPFTSALLGDYSNNPLAVDIFAVNLLLASLATQATFELGRRGGLLTAGHHDVARRAGLLRGAGVGVVLVASMGIAWVNPGNAKYLWLLLALIPRAVDAWLRRHPGRERGEHAAGPGDGRSGQGRP
jgi:uncharacterized membrane protein